jgi:protein ImuB
MFWIALQPTHEHEGQAWGWWALQFTPRVAWLEEALVLETCASEKLFGGRKRLLQLLLHPPDLASSSWARGSSSLVALALLRLKLRGQAPPSSGRDGLPLAVLSAAAEHLATLERIGCDSWGALRALPRSGVARRFGAGLLEALDVAYGERPERHHWLALPGQFDQQFELPALATSAPELMWSAQRLLSQLQVWLQARNRGVLALELEWTLDLKRHNGVHLPGHEQLAVRTAQATQDMVHLRRLVGEHLDRARLCAPASHLRLRTLETQPWAGISRSFLPQDNRKGEPLHQLVERLSVRLGEGNVLVAQGCEDHRPERKQQWLPARQCLPSSAPEPDALYPTWLLPQPLLLTMQGDTPCYGGPLQRLTRMYRVEGNWWEGGAAALRDYFVARSPQEGLVWIFRERPQQMARGLEGEPQLRWYLQGLYA